MKNFWAKAALVTGLATLPLTTHIDGKNNLSETGIRAESDPTEEVIKITRSNVLFTIDDGPTKYMLDIAKTLDSLHYQGIFYVVTRGITDRTKGDMIEVLKMGHHIGNHSYDHPNFQTLTIDQAKKQILTSDQLISSVYEEAGIPREKKYIRFPYGNQPPKYYREEFTVFLDSLGYEKPMFRHMDVDLYDCAKQPTDDKIGRMKQGDTILLHERAWTINTINKIVDHLDIPPIL